MVPKNQGTLRPSKKRVPPHLLTNHQGSWTRGLPVPLGPLRTALEALLPSSGAPDGRSEFPGQLATSAQPMRWSLGQGMSWRRLGVRAETEDQSESSAKGSFLGFAGSSVGVGESKQGPDSGDCSGALGRFGVVTRAVMRSVWAWGPTKFGEPLCELHLVLIWGWGLYGWGWYWAL